MSASGGATARGIGAVAAAAGRPGAAANVAASAGNRGALHLGLSVLSACGKARQAGAAAAS